jgi:hypothetical protein
MRHGRVTQPPQVAQPADKSRALADAAFVGWLPLVAINAVFARLVTAKLSLGQIVLHHVYDAGQVLGLAVASWLAVRALGRLPRVAAVVVAVALLFLAHYALFEDDLASFLLRHEDSRVPWHPLFSAVGALSVAGSFGVGYLIAGRRLRYAGIALGLSVFVANHLVLPLVYRGAHFTLAWSAAMLIGLSLWRDVAALELPRARRALFASATALLVLTYALPASAVVRVALLGSTGAVAAPFAALAWATLEGAAEPLHESSSPWFQPREKLPPIAPEALPGKPDAPIVVLLTVDALRNDVLERKKAVPKLLEMRRKSLHFEHVWSPASYTMASLRTMFTGTYYLQHDGRKSEKARRNAGQRVESMKHPYLASLLNDGGVATVNVRSQNKLASKGSVCRGFATEQRVRTNDARYVVRGVRDYLTKAPKGPMFIYGHLMDPHAPYDSNGKKGTAFERYVAEVSLVDREIGGLRKFLRKNKLDRDTYLIVTADHAEAFGEHGYFFHSDSVYEEMIRIPMFVEGPGVKPRLVKDRAVSLVDLGPTILSLFGLPTPGHFMGQDLVPFMRGDTPEIERPLAVDNGASGMRAMLFDNRWKAMVSTRGEEVYDLRDDPKETLNLAEDPRSRAQLATLRAFFAGLVPKAK